MEIIKKNISMSHIIGKGKAQITLNEDIIVPDSKSDIHKKIVCGGDAAIDTVKISEQKISVTGKLSYNLLYQTEDNNNPYDCMTGEVEFAETVNMPEVTSRDYARCTVTLEDINVSLINSRKISLAAVLTVEICASKQYVTPAGVEVNDENACVQTKNLEVLSLVDSKRDILRVREHQDIDSNRPNIGSIVWSSPKLRGLEIRTGSDEVIIRGEINVFVMHIGEDSYDGLQYCETVMPFTGKVALAGVNENMIADVNITTSSVNVSVKPDYDGEPRTLEAEAVLDVDIRMYEEQVLNLVTDVYSLSKKVIPIITHTSYDRLLVKNHTKCKVAEKHEVSGEHKVLQVINCDSTLGIDDITIVEDGILVEGAVKVCMLYISDNDEEKLCSLSKEIPFSQTIEAMGIEKDSFYTVRAQIEQQMASMSGGNEIEIKVIVGLEALVLNPMHTDVISDANEETLDFKELKKLPGAWGYVVDDNDTLWDIAKTHHTTMERILELNNMTEENIKPGCKLFILKETKLA